jgi:hypothetical protein
MLGHDGSSGSSEAALLSGRQNHASIANVIGHRFPASGLDGALKPYDRLIYPVVVTHRISLSFLTTDGCLGYALVTLIHHKFRSPRFRPSRGDGAVDNMPLNPTATRAGKGSQVLAQRARLYRRQLHWRTASCTLRTLVLCIEHVRPLSSVLLVHRQANRERWI